MSSVANPSLDLADMKRINWAEAFSHYCAGLPLTDIALMLSISEQKLVNRAQSERWPTMKARIEAQSLSLAPVHPDEIARRAELIQQNREENYRAWCKLRDDAIDIINDLRSTRGKKMVTKLFHNKGAVIEHVTDLTIGERATLANYLQVIAQGTYAALGDRVASTGGKDDATSNPSGQAGITIILPGVVSKPRAERAVKGVDATVTSSGPVIDLREV